MTSAELEKLITDIQNGVSTSIDPACQLKGQSREAILAVLNPTMDGKGPLAAARAAREKK